MAKRRKRKALNMERRIREAEQVDLASRNPAALALALHFRNRRHQDDRKEASRRACRGRVTA